MPSDYTACACGVRVIIARGVPPLNYGPDPAGTVAAEHKASGAWKARFLARGEQVAAPEKRYAVHECEHTRHRAQRARWTSAIGDLHAGQRRSRGRRKRGAPNPIDSALPGMGRINPGRTP